MFFLFTYLTISDPNYCIDGETNCLLCLENSECSFCRSNSLCYNSSSTLFETECVEKVSTRDKQCVRELGYDAKQSFRYAFGFTVLGVSILIDIIVRIYSRPKTNDDYSKL